MPYHVYFHESIVELNRELHHHPDLEKLVAKYDAHMQLSEILAIVAAYCGISLDAMFTVNELYQLSHKLVLLLKKKREIIIS